MKSSNFTPNEINRINPDNECHTQEISQKNKQKKESEKIKWSSSQMFSCIVSDSVLAKYVKYITRSYSV